MDPELTDEARSALTAAADFITSLVRPEEAEVTVVKDVTEEEVADETAPHECVKGDKPCDCTPADEPKVAGEDAPMDDEDVKKDKPAEDAPAAEDMVAESTNDDGYVTDKELLDVMNHVVEEITSVKERITALEDLSAKLDKVGDLAKSLNVTDQVDELRSTTTEIDNKLADTTSTLEAVSKRLEEIASTPGASAAIAVDTAPKVEEVAKADLGIRSHLSGLL